MDSIVRERILKSIKDGDVGDSQLDDRIESFGLMMRDAMNQLSNEIDAVTGANKRRRAELRRISSRALRNFAQRVDKQIEIHQRLDQLERCIVNQLADREAVKASKALLSLGSRVSSLQDRLINYFRRNKEVSSRPSPHLHHERPKAGIIQSLPHRLKNQLDLDGKIQSLERRLDRIQGQVMDSNEQTLEILNSTLALRQLDK